MKKILVLLSSYNGEKYITEQIESIMNQKVNCEVKLRIRDDGSKDSTCQIIENLQKKYEQIELIKGKNIGYNASFFELMNQADGYDYYSISDQDDVWMENKLSIALSYLEKEDPSIPCLYASTSYLVKDDLVPYSSTRKKERDMNFYNTIVQNICLGHTQMLNNALLQIVKGNVDTNRMYAYDLWTCNMAMLYGKICFDNDSHTYYRQHSDNSFGQGKSAFGKLLLSGKRILNGDGPKSREQIAYFVEYNEQKCKERGFYPEMERFLNSTSFLKRLIYSFTSKIYRQKKVETLAFRVAILLGKY